MSHVVRTHFIAPKELIEEVDKLVGPRRRSEFLTKAATKELQREKLLRLTREVSKLPPGGGILNGILLSQQQSGCVKAV